MDDDLDRDVDFIHDSEPEREAERSRKLERRAARRAARTTAGGEGSAGTTSSAPSGGDDDDDEMQYIGSSASSVSLQPGTMSTYFDRKRITRGSPTDFWTSPQPPSLSRAGSSSLFRAPAIPKAHGSAARDFVYSHPPRSSPLKPPTPTELIDDAAADDDPIGEGPRRSGKNKDNAKDESSACPFNDAQLRELKECVLCKETWTSRKLAKSKWNHLVACKPSISLSAVIRAVRDHLDRKRRSPSRASSSASSKRAASVTHGSDSGVPVFKADIEPEVVELSTSEDEALPEPRPDQQSAAVLTTPASARPVDVPRSFSPFQTPSPTSSARDRSNDSPPRSPPPKMDLSRFAHEAAGSTSSIARANKPSLKKGRVPVCPVGGETLRKLKQCVFCGENWLLKPRIGKTKWQHSWKCSQAQSEPFTVLAVQEAIEQAVLPPPPSLLDETLPHRKKPTRKASTVETTLIAVGSELAREAIMGRVGQVLGEVVAVAGPSTACAPDDGMPPPPFPTTQAFSTSGLGSRFGLARDGHLFEQAADSGGQSTSAETDAVDQPMSLPAAAEGSVSDSSRKRKLGPSTSAENLVDPPPAEPVRRPSKLAAKFGGGPARGTRGLFDLGAA